MSARKWVDQKPVIQSTNLEGSVRNTGTHACGLLLHPMILRIMYLLLCKGFGYVCALNMIMQ